MDPRPLVPLIDPGQRLVRKKDLLRLAELCYLLSLGTDQQDVAHRAIEALPLTIKSATMPPRTGHYVRFSDENESHEL